MSNPIRRKVQLTGGSTYIISLPKEWIKNVRLTSGSEVLIEIQPDYTLKIIPENKKLEQQVNNKEIEITPETINTAVTEVLSAYLAGYNKIKIKYKNIDIESIRKIIDSAINKALGLEVLEEKANELTLYSVINTTSLTMQEAMEKMMNTTRSMLEDVEKNLIKIDEDSLCSIIDRDNVVDKLFLLVMRQLNQVLLGELSTSQLGLTTLPEALYVVITVKSIERIADHAVLISKNMLNAPKRIMITDQVVNLFSLAKEAYMNAIRGFNKKDKRYINKAITIAIESNRLEEKIRLNITSLTGSPEIYPILDSIKRIRAYSLDIAESTSNIITIRELVNPSKNIT